MLNEKIVCQIDFEDFMENLREECKIITHQNCPPITPTKIYEVVRRIPLLRKHEVGAIQMAELLLALGFTKTVAGHIYFYDFA